MSTLDSSDQQLIHYQFCYNWAYANVFGAIKRIQFVTVSFW